MPYLTPPMTMHSMVMVRHMLTSKTAFIGRESNTETRPRGILLCKELPISFSRKDQGLCRIGFTMQEFRPRRQIIPPICSLKATDVAISPGRTARQRQLRTASMAKLSER
jgi:hypothetical protein